MSKNNHAPKNLKQQCLWEWMYGMKLARPDQDRFPVSTRKKKED